MPLITKTKNMQKQAINKLITKSKQILGENSCEKTIDFEILKGTKKEVVIGRYIKELLRELENQEICFLWMSLENKNSCEQIYENLKKEFGAFPSCYLFEQEFHGSRKIIMGNEVVVVNRNKLRRKDSQTGEWKNALMKSSEKINFRELVKNTKNENTKIIMIVDKNYLNNKSERADELKDIVNADLIIAMSVVPF